jgi:hypothetical protein
LNLIGWAIALIAINRLLGVTKSFEWTSFLSKYGERKCTAIMILVSWILNLVWYAPKFVEEASYKVNKFSGFCDTIQNGTRVINSKYSAFINYPEFVTTFVIITVSYCCIAVYVFKSSKNMKQMLGQASENEYQKRIHSRNMRITMVMAIICITYIMLIAPALTIDMAVVDIGSNGLLVFALYIFQYSINIFVYFVTKEDYRVAYYDTLRYLFCTNLFKFKDAGTIKVEMNKTDTISTDI